MPVGFVTFALVGGILLCAIIIPALLAVAIAGRMTKEDLERPDDPLYIQRPDA